GSLFIYHTMTGRKNGSHRINRTFLNLPSLILTTSIGSPAHPFFFILSVKSAARIQIISATLGHVDGGTVSYR
ncbi:hypothetical protein, partial [Erwinia sp. V71]|uniref:hypothetical protein n=1 Tax=Erwinia sp. V71 TaxID=3369424 RepID=UPI003F5E89D4